MSGGGSLDHLSDRQREALEAALAYVVERFEPWAVVVAGTLVRGEGDERSDLDVYVLHDEPYRKRVQRWFGDTPVEIFVNPVSAVLDYFKREEKARGPSTAHMLATGIALLGEDNPRLETLRARARESLANPPQVEKPALVRSRYGPATHVEDALDRRDADPGTAMRLLAKGVEGAIEHWFRLAGRYFPRSKAVLAELEAEDPELGSLARRFWGDDSWDDRWEAGLDLTDRILRTRGFFEWESEDEPV